MSEKVSEDIIKILEACSFDTEFSLLTIGDETISDIEEYVNENPSILSDTSYKNVLKFRLKPGHKSIILNLPLQIKRMKEKDADEISHISDYSHILKTFIEAAETNMERHRNGFRYSDTNQYFSTFIYLMCGRSCYDTLSANLPIPTSNTICKSNSRIFIKMKFPFSIRIIFHI